MLCSVNEMFLAVRTLYCVIVRGQGAGSERKCYENVRDQIDYSEKTD